MKSKIFKSIFLVAMAVFVACFGVIMVALYNYFSEEHYEKLKEETSFLATAVNENGEGFLSKIDTDETSSRVTYVDKDGIVLYDSVVDARTLENHANREEIKQAYAKGVGSSTRYSNTLSEKNTYYAVLLDNGSVLRVCTTQYTILTLLIEMFYPIIAVLIIAVAFSMFLAFRVSKNLMRPVNEIDLESPDDRDVYPELKPLVKRINVQNRQLQRQVEELKLEHEKQDNMRREFTANVSHELKTPLTSISGYAEIMREGLAKPEDISRFSGKIYDEAGRLIVLVGDIIKLSQLDEKKLAPVEKIKINLLDSVRDVVSHLESVAEKRGVDFKIDGENLCVNGVQQIIDEVIYNLCDNAIKYNKENGTIFIRVYSRDESTVLEVKDTGIGIPSDEQERVFERFYRVDKSHSKEVGGTGLGLSIVKHGANYHSAQVEIESELEKGTTIRIVFPSIK